MADYVNLASDLITLAKTSGVPDTEINKLLDQEAKTISRINGRFKNATYRPMLNGRNDIKLWRIDLQEDSRDHGIFGRTTDFSPSSLKRLIERGRRDAVISLNKARILFCLDNLISQKKVSHEDADQLIQNAKRISALGLYSMPEHQIISGYNNIVSYINEKLSSLPEEHRKSLIDYTTNILHEVVND